MHNLEADECYINYFVIQGFQCCGAWAKGVEGQIVFEHTVEECANGSRQPPLISSYDTANLDCLPPMGAGNLSSRSRCS